MRYFIFWNATLNRFETVKTSNRDRAKKIISNYHNSEVELSYKFYQSEFPYKLNPFCIPVGMNFQIDLEQLLKYPEDYEMLPDTKIKVNVKTTGLE